MMLRAFDPLSTLNLQKSTFRGSFAVRCCRVTDEGGVSRTPLRHLPCRSARSAAHHIIERCADIAGVIFSNMEMGPLGPR
jgi:hypothetical protein